MLKTDDAKAAARILRNITMVRARDSRDATSEIVGCRGTTDA